MIAEPYKIAGGWKRIEIGLGTMENSVLLMFNAFEFQNSIINLDFPE